MNNEDIIAFFDRLAPTWDEHMVIDGEVIETILNNAEVSSGKEILDVACGTGVMIPFYLEREVSFVRGIDLSPKMCGIAKGKFMQNNVEIVCADVLTYSSDRKYDCIMVYNAFPHFDDPCLLIRTLAGMLKGGGTLSIAHGMSREKIIEHHAGAAHVSKVLPEISELRKMMENELEVIVS
ncbi:MAG: class I SAM-dependent methyltransferase, partial [Erysipelotrichaceae bacterium]|nr:class I SAM-dependent methyltransferase [Erysipelotrichaceae bacterium]